jgi:hypothetical protein
MRWTMIGAATALLLGGCVVNPVPDGYSGSLAHISDSITPRSDISTDFFYVAKINGFAIPDSLWTTEGDRTPAAAKKPTVIARDVPAEAATFTLIAHTHYVATAYAFANPVYDVTGDVSFAPAAGHDYVVKGVLGPDYSAIWIEDKQTGQVASQKLEVKGSAAIGAFGKILN